MVNGNGAEQLRVVPPHDGSGLATNALVRESLHESLRVQVLVPQGGEAFVFAVKLGVKGVHALTNEAAPLLDSGVIVAVVLCEAPDYVKRSFTTWLRRSVHAALVFALLNIVRDSSRTDIRSARGDYGPVIEEGPIAFRLRGQL